MSRRLRPMGLFLLMLWVPPALLFSLRMAGCSLLGVESTELSIHAPAADAGYSALDAEGVSF